MLVTELYFLTVCLPHKTTGFIGQCEIPNNYSSSANIVYLVAIYCNIFLVAKKESNAFE